VDAKLLRAEAGVVVVMTSTGVLRIPIDTVPGDVLTAWGLGRSTIPSPVAQTAPRPHGAIKDRTITFTDSDGTTRADVKVLRTEPDAIVVMTSTGVLRLPIASIPHELLQSLGYADPTSPATSEPLRQRHAAQMGQPEEDLRPASGLGGDGPQPSVAGGALRSPEALPETPGQAVGLLDVPELLKTDRGQRILHTVLRWGLRILVGTIAAAIAWFIIIISTRSLPVRYPMWIRRVGIVSNLQATETVAMAIRKYGPLPGSGMSWEMDELTRSARRELRDDSETFVAGLLVRFIEASPYCYICGYGAYERELAREISPISLSARPHSPSEAAMSVR